MYIHSTFPFNHFIERKIIPSNSFHVDETPFHSLAKMAIIKSFIHILTVGFFLAISTMAAPASQVLGTVHKTLHNSIHGAFTHHSYAPPPADPRDILRLQAPAFRLSLTK